MHPTILAAFFEISRIAVAMCSAGIAIFLIGVLAAKTEIAQARGLDKIGINYFADTLLFAGAILALASATPAAAS